jgi:hypothetical protein
MNPAVEDFDDHRRFRQILEIPYSEIVPFVFDHIRKKSGVNLLFMSVCILFLGIAITIRIDIAGYFSFSNVFKHTLTGLIIFPLLCVPVHEFIHIVPYYLYGARKIRVGMDLQQFIFYVTAHKHVAGRLQFIIVALLPFILISFITLIFILYLPGLWKWSFSLFLFVHSTMCAGDFAMLNFYWINRKKKIYTWDDADMKIAYFYEEMV